MDITKFILAFESPEADYLEELRQIAEASDVPIIKRETQSLLKVLIQMKKPKRILEIGTAIGYSALLMKAYAIKAQITTIENYPKRLELARENFQKLDEEGQINLIAGDAGEVITGLDETYDVIFVDGPKGQYIGYLEDLLRLLAPEGILVTDNILQDGDVCKSRYAIRRRDHTIHKRMREFLEAIKHDSRLTTALLPVGDGVALSYKN
ncbi:putative O-methyltransferase YrrM [Lachnospiraceae bacterium PM6-15]|uniref:tRNA 5-hydroxyuridine methyltransferase n=1 Tax=Ohessyouella blattaphilus TaxID=2949333 RepID=A0ABT1EGX1_9FIRM|nr:O-methyltransferase [Ohessyouella blattaphilus]MCP1109943.1 O-methyltransferase [Ohessyouella blattaphilus]MCR8563337.1 O-methyltransferase [Ohessyouella blattaphilus]